MATLINEPLSRAEAGRLAGSYDTVLLRATREADLETPISTFLALDDGTPAYLLESVEGGERLGRYSFIGRLPRRLLDVRDGLATIHSRPVGTEHPTDLPAETSAAADPLDALRSFLPQRRVAPLPDLARFFGGAVGALAYDAVAQFEPTVRLPERDPVGAPLAAFMETDLVVVVDHLTHTLSAIAALHTDAPDFDRRYAVAERAVLDALERAGAPPRPGVAAGSRNGRDTQAAPVETSLGRNEYMTAVEHAQTAIRDGEAIQVVLARRQSMSAAGAGGASIGGIDLYRALRRLSPSPYLFFLRLPDFEVVGASPELLLRVEGGHMITHPIAGTRPRGATPAADAELARDLAADRKERAEHVMLVDLARNDIGRVARPGSVVVSRFGEVERFSHVQHLVSHVEGELREGHGALDALRAVFPAGTLSGAPKVRAMQLIGELEGERRGLYGGAVGYLGYDGSLDTAITIRSAVLAGGRIHVHSGAGIVAGSVPEREFEETEQKALAMRRAIEMATGASAGAAEASAEPIAALGRAS
ncbi:MAG TPA: anthranilate synthase component I family protein [Candidatus Limnocylindria bacterium]|nr:anthranilate synthase component I family protein [Candidatus Limnocylindria bacterium]